MPKEPLIVTIVLDGGLVQDVIVPKELANVQFRIRDYDIHKGRTWSHLK